MATVTVCGPCIICGHEWSFCDTTIWPPATLYIDTKEQTMEIICVNSQECERKAGAARSESVSSDSDSGGVPNKPMGQQAMHVTLSPSPVPGMPGDILPTHAPTHTPMCGEPTE